MPEVNDTKLYKAIFNSAKNVFANSDLLKQYVKVLDKGSPLYRYTNYRNGPQTENSCRKIWSLLANDKKNRWTGYGVEVSRGSQGLYCSAEYFDKEKPFPELEHYMNPADPNTAGDVSYYEYSPEKEPTKSTVAAESLRSMFLFTSKENVPVLDLSLYGGSDLLNRIFNTAKQDFPNDVPANKTLEELYTDAGDYSFSRAIGNAVFETTEIKAIQTTSARDGVSDNIVLKGVQNETIDILKPEGRATFFLDPEGKAKGVYTIADLLYNAQFEETGLGHLAPRDTQVKMLENVATGMANKLSTDFHNAIELNPPTEATQKVARRLETIIGHFKGQEIPAALSELNQLSTDIAKLPKKDLPQYEAKAVETVERTVDALSTITTSIKANEERSGNTDPKQQSEPVIDPPEEMLPEFLERK